ncbi:hypothetical protein [Macrococcus bovicus]|uniref:hypothetical protein n=1 Tax=Macrococcus bovicus TaxID=69968 RepID=UPI0025A53792|nr:hypothetical protein [Macrococcus bovicus]WJP96773.1 hypothetical protein QSV55_00235 [Macrococcus bovicus]
MKNIIFYILLLLGFLYSVNLLITSENVIQKFIIVVLLIMAIFLVIKGYYDEKKNN